MRVASRSSSQNRESPKPPRKDHSHEAEQISQEEQVGFVSRTMDFLTVGKLHQPKTSPREGGATIHTRLKGAQQGRTAT